MQENWLKRPDGTELYVRFNQPDQCKATLILIHGVAENIKRYDAFFEELGKAGIKCGGYDQRGFGQTCKKNGNRGHLGEEQDHFDDITAVCEFLKNGPLFIMGQSMGGGTALKYAYSHPDNIVGVIGASPFIDFAPGSAPLLHEKIAMAILPAIVPKLALPKPLDVGHLSNDPRVGEEFSKDELNHSYISVLTGVQSIKRAKSLRSEICFKFDKPLLLAHGTNDMLTGFDGSKSFFENAASTDKTFEIFEGAKHELHNEIEPHRSRAIELYKSWILARAK